MKLRRKVALLSTLVLTLSLFTGCGKKSGDTAVAGKGTIKLEVAFNQPENHPQFKAMQEFAEAVKEKTDGKYDIEIYPNELLGAQKETIEMTQSGSIAMTIVASSLMESWNSDFCVFNLPYVFDSVEAQKKIINDTAIVGDLYNSLTDKGLKVLGGFHSGVRNVYTKKTEVKTPADLAGLKIRVMQSDTNVKMMELMGGTGTAMGQGEVYTAIQTGVLDGGENSELIYSGLKHVEVAPNYIYTKHLMMPDLLVINNDIYEKMSDDVKKIVNEEFQKAVDHEFEMFGDDVDAATESAKKAGAKFLEIDTTPFKEAVKPLINSKINTDATKKIYQKIVELNK